MSEQASDPWAATESVEDNSSSPWGSGESTNADISASLSAGVEEQIPFSLADPFSQEWIPLQDWVETFVSWLVLHLGQYFRRSKLQ